MVDEYMAFHYCPADEYMSYNFGPVDANDFTKRCAELCLRHKPVIIKAKKLAKIVIEMRTSSTLGRTDRQSDMHEQ